MERAKYDAEMKAAADEEAAKVGNLLTTPITEIEKVGIEKRIREGKDDKVFKVRYCKSVCLFEQTVI